MKETIAGRILKKFELKEMAPQLIEPLSSTITSEVCSWIEKVYQSWKKTPSNYNLKRLHLSGLSDKKYHIYQLINAKYGTSKVNFIFQIHEEKCVLFSKYEVKKRKGLPIETVTQVLLWRDKTVTSTSNIPSHEVTEKIIFPMTGGLLCDKQQTSNGRNAWEYIVKTLGYDKGNIVGVYDSMKKKFIKFETREEYDETIDQYYSHDFSSIRYQIAIINKDKVNGI